MDFFRSASLANMAMVSATIHVGAVAGYMALSEPTHAPKHLLHTSSMSVEIIPVPRLVTQDLSSVVKPQKVVVPVDPIASKSKSKPIYKVPQPLVSQPLVPLESSHQSVQSTQALPLQSLSDMNVKQAYMPAPIYPKSALRRHQQGLVVVTFHLSNLGQVLNAFIEESCGVKELDKAAIEAVKQWRFPKVVAKTHPVIKAPIRFVI